MLEQCVDGLACAVDDVQHSLGKSRLEKDLGESLAAQRRAFRRLEHEGVARDDRQREHPQRNHHGEVEWRDAGANPERVAIEVLVNSA